MPHFSYLVCVFISLFAPLHDINNSNNSGGTIYSKPPPAPITDANCGVQTAERTMMTDDLDDLDNLSLQLAIALQLQDIDVAIASRKGKGRAGDAITSNDEVAFQDYRRHLEMSAQILLDQRLARSFDRAVRTDADELMQLTRAELRDERDRELAFQLSEDPAEKLMKKLNSRLRPFAIGSGVEATDAELESWVQKSIEWDIIEAKVLFIFGPYNIP